QRLVNVARDLAVVAHHRPQAITNFRRQSQKESHLFPPHIPVLASSANWAVASCGEATPPTKVSGRLNRKWIRFQRLVWSIEQDVAVYANSELIARRDFDRWLYVQVAPGDHCAGLTHLTANRRACGIGDARIR